MTTKKDTWEAHAPHLLHMLREKAAGYYEADFHRMAKEADAAAALLEALQNLLEAVTNVYPTIDGWNEALDAKAAIAQAEGRDA